MNKIMKNAITANGNIIAKYLKN